MNKYYNEIIKIKSDEYGTNVNDLLKENEIIYLENQKIKFKMISFGYSTIIIGDSSILTQIKSILNEADSINVFDAPYLFMIDTVLHRNNLSLNEICDFFIPSKNFIQDNYHNNGYKIQRIDKYDIPNIENLEKYENALSLDEYISMNEIAYVALEGNEIVSIAGASSNSEKIWWIGVDTVPHHRRRGLASFLVNKVANEVLMIDRIPVYPTWYSNISSRLTAIKAGFIPGFIELEC